MDSTRTQQQVKCPRCGWYAVKTLVRETVPQRAEDGSDRVEYAQYSAWSIDCGHCGYQDGDND